MVIHNIEGEHVTPKPLHSSVIASYRALRVLEILYERSSREQPLASESLIWELEHPSTPVQPVSTGNKALYSAVSALRAAGYRISQHGAVGYVLESRPLSDEDIADLLCIVESSPSLGWERIRVLSHALIDLASPCLRQQEEAKRSKQRTQERPPATSSWDLRLLDLDALVHASIACGGILLIEIKPADADAHFSPGQSHAPLRYRPLRVVRRAGNIYVVGMIKPTAHAPEIIRTIDFEHIRTATLVNDGAIYNYTAQLEPEEPLPAA